MQLIYCTVVHPALTVCILECTNQNVMCINHLPSRREDRIVFPEDFPLCAAYKLIDVGVRQLCFHKVATSDNGH